MFRFSMIWNELNLKAIKSRKSIIFQIVEFIIKINLKNGLNVIMVFDAFEKLVVGNFFILLEIVKLFDIKLDNL